MFQSVRNLFSHQVVADPIEKWCKQNILTPDLAYLQEHVRQNIFIPDDLMKGNVNHHLIEDHEPIHPACYTHNKFTAWKKDLGTYSFPLPFEEGVDFEVYTLYKPELARLRGELYSLPSHFFWKVLDIHKQNGVQFFRRRVPITLPFRHVTFSRTKPIPRISRDYFRTVGAWMYVANPEYWNDFIGVSLGSRAVEMYEHDTPKDWIEKFYKFANN